MTRIALFLLSIMAFADSKILVHGHRGARAMRPENTIPAFEYAIQAGVDVLGLDMAGAQGKVLGVPPYAYLEAPGWRGAPPLVRDLEVVALWKVGDRDSVSIAQEAGATIVSPAYRLVTPEKVRAAHAAGLQVVPWTANTPADWDKLVAAQVDAIISDDPAELIGYLKSKALR